MHADQIRQNLIRIAGAGRIAQSLGRLLCDQGETIAAVASRSLPRAQIATAFIGVGTEPVSYPRLPARVSRLLIAASDEAIESVTRSLARTGITEGVALHTSGVYGPKILKPLSRLGVSCATLHPLQTVCLHLKALQGELLPDSEHELYGAAGRHTLQLAQQKGLPQAKAVALQEVIEKELTLCRKV